MSRTNIQERPTPNFTKAIQLYMATSINLNWICLASALALYVDALRVKNFFKL